jgi:hypothetical protein
MTVKSVYFVLRAPGRPEATNYQHGSISLAEGLRELGIPFFSNIPYWQNAPDSEFLFQSDPEVKPQDCDVVVLEHCWFDYVDAPRLPQCLLARRRAFRSVYLDLSDGFATRSWPLARYFDLVLRGHYSSQYMHPRNAVPWAFGLTNRILRELKTPPDWDCRAQRLLWNFRVPHAVRHWAAMEFLPRFREIAADEAACGAMENCGDGEYERLHWRQTGRRHHRSYFASLQACRFCAAFGGRFIPAWPRHPSMTLGQRIVNRLSPVLNRVLPAKERVYQWDSWRLWESLAAGCATICLDFEKYGFVLPAMPRNFVHYIGVDMDDPAAACRVIGSNRQLAPQIAREGRDWAIANYSPLAVARRFLDLLTKEHPAL